VNKEKPRIQNSISFHFPHFSSNQTRKKKTLKLRNSVTHPGDRIKNTLLDQNPGDPRVEKAEREAKNEDIVKGVVDSIG